MRVEIVGQSADSDEAGKTAPSRLVNLYSEVHDGKRLLRSVLGHEAWTTLPNAGSQVAHFADNRIYAANAGELHQITAAGNTTFLGTINNSPNTTVSSNNGNVTVASNGEYFVWDGTVLSQPTTGAISNIADVSFFAQYTVLIEGDGRKVQWSSLADPKTFGGLDYATAESRDDKNLRGMPVSGSFWVFKERSIEQWYATGSGLAYVPGSVRDIGLKARNLVATYEGGAFWVSNTGRVYVSSGSIISTPAVEDAIENGSPVSCQYYRDKGHDFLCILFEDRPAWCFNVATREWHERAEGDALGRWGVMALTSAWGDAVAITDDGSVVKLKRRNADLAEPLHRRVITRKLGGDGKRFRVPRVEAAFNTGEALQENEVLLRLSRDHGKTWGQWDGRSLGPQGDYARRVEWRSLGQFETLVAEFALSATDDITMETEITLDIA